MAEIMIKAAGFVFVIIIAFILKQVHVLEKRDGLTIATIIMNVTLPCALLTNASGVTIDQSMLILLLIGFLLLIKGADGFVSGASSIAKKFRIPSTIICIFIRSRIPMDSMR